jgi:hypothetical protein
MKPTNETRAEIVALCNEVVTTSAAIADRMIDTVFANNTTAQDDEFSDACAKYRKARDRLAAVLSAYEVVDVVFAPAAPQLHAVIRGATAKRARYGAPYVAPAADASSPAKSAK